MILKVFLGVIAAQPNSVFFNNLKVLFHVERYVVLQLLSHRVVLHSFLPLGRHPSKLRKKREKTDRAVSRQEVGLRVDG